MVTAVFCDQYAREAGWRQGFLEVTTRVEVAYSTAHFAPRFAPLTRVNTGWHWVATPRQNSKVTVRLAGIGRWRVEQQ